MLLSVPSEVETHGIESTNFTVNFNAKAYAIFSDKLYSDKNGSVAREYLTNAYDSHRSANKKDIPIHVTLPTSVDPNYTVLDYGVGMSKEEAIKAFSGMFDSSKDQSENDIGGYGLGSKSAFAITSSFSATCIKDGMCTQLLMFKSTDGIPQIAEVFHGHTDKPNGVCISIPVAVNNIQEFCCSAQEQMYGIYPKPECNLEFNSLFDEGVIKYENDLLYIVEDEQKAGATFVLNGVTLYRVPLDKMRHLVGNYQPNCYAAILKSKINSLDVPPSRETLEYTTKTTNFLNQQYQYVMDFVADELVCAIESSKHTKALSIYKEIDKRKELLGYKLFGSNFLYNVYHENLVIYPPALTKFKKTMAKEIVYLTKHLKLVLFANRKVANRKVVNNLSVMMWSYLMSDVIVCSDKPMNNYINQDTPSTRQCISMMIQEKNLKLSFSTVLFKTTKKNGIKEYHNYRLSQIKKATAFVNRFLGEGMLTLMPLSVLKSIANKPVEKKERKEPTSVRMEGYRDSRDKKTSFMFDLVDSSEKEIYWIDENSVFNKEYLLLQIAQRGEISIIVASKPKHLKVIQENSVRCLEQWISNQHTLINSDEFAAWLFKTRFNEIKYTYSHNEIEQKMCKFSTLKCHPSVMNLLSLSKSSCYSNNYDKAYCVAYNVNQRDTDNIFGFEDISEKEFTFSNIKFTCVGITLLNKYCSLLESVSELSNNTFVSLVVQDSLRTTKTQILSEMDQLLLRNV